MRARPPCGIPIVASSRTEINPNGETLLSPITRRDFEPRHDRRFGQAGWRRPGPCRPGYAAAPQRPRCRPRSDPAPLRRHDDRHSRDAPLRQAIWPQGAGAPDQLVTAFTHAVARHRRPARRRLFSVGQGFRQAGACPATAVAGPGNAEPGGVRVDLGRSPRSRDATRWTDGSFAPFRYYLVPRRDAQISQATRRSFAGFAFPPAIRLDLSAVLPGRDRQGARA